MLTAKEEYIWDTLTELGIATSEEIGLVTALMGRSEETLNSILYVRTGYRNLEQMFEEDEEQDSSFFYACPCIKIQKRTYVLKKTLLCDKKHFFGFLLGFGVQFPKLPRVKLFAGRPRPQRPEFSRFNVLK